MDNINFKDIPMGFGMALLRNPDAVMYYNSLSETEKQQIIEKTHTINSKSEMKAFVDSLKGNTFT